jgi:hypothetical protein
VVGPRIEVPVLVPLVYVFLALRKRFTTTPSTPARQRLDDENGMIDDDRKPCDSPAPPDLSISQRLALKSAATRLESNSPRRSAPRPSNGSCPHLLRPICRPPEQSQLPASARRSVRPPTTACADTGRRQDQRCQTQRAVPPTYNAGTSRSPWSADRGGHSIHYRRNALYNKGIGA